MQTVILSEFCRNAMSSLARERRKLSPEDMGENHGMCEET